MYVLVLILTVVLLVVPRSHADVLCDGVDDLLSTGLNMTVFMSLTTGTISVWVQPSGPATGAQTVAYHGQGMVSMDDRNLGLWRTTLGTDQLWAQLYDGGERETGASFTNNQWTHLAWVHSAGALLFYKDGQQMGGNITAGNPETTDVLQACHVPGGLGALPYQGKIGALAFYPTALNAGQIATLGKSRVTQPNVTATPSGFWPMDQCAPGVSANGLAFVDRSGNGRPLTASSSNGGGLLCQGSPWLSGAGRAY